MKIKLDLMVKKNGVARKKMRVWLCADVTVCVIVSVFECVCACDIERVRVRVFVCEMKTG